MADGDLDHADRLQRALRDIATALAEANSEARPRLVQVTGRRVEAVLSQPVLPAPPGWKAEASGSAWVLKGEPCDRGESDATPNPALVTIGRPDARTELYLDLEAEGVVALTGEAAAVAAVARSWVLELATSPLASGASVAVIGDHLRADWGESDRVRVAGSWEEMASDAVMWVEQSAALLKAKRWATPLVGRLTSRRADDLAPLIIFAEHPDDEGFETLCTAILEHQVSVVLVVVGGATEGATIVEVRGEKLSIPALGLTCQAQAVSIAATEQVSDLIEDASRLPVQLSLIPVPAPRAPVSLGSSGDEYSDPHYEILVRLLGDIAVVGGRKELKAKQTAVLAYIALQAPVSSERVGDALWVAATESRRKRLANTVSECRNALGAGHLPLATDGRYRVGPGVVTDVELFERRLACAADQDDEAAAATLRGALELVEGPVFTYRNVDRASYVWVDVENWISTWELKVTDTAEDLAERYLDLENFDGAVWSAQRGLSASPTHSRLTKVLIKAYFAKGDARAAEQVFESHQAALDKLDLDEVDAELVGFYYDARRARAAAAS